MQKDPLVLTEQFVKEEFKKHPHFSFGDGSVMYNHSVMVKDIALQIAEHVECDAELVAVGALLHDIGKTYVADEDTLHFEHEKFNLQVSKDFIDSVPLSEEQKSALRSIISYESDSTEASVIKDADALALYADKKLYMLFIEWAVRNELRSSIQRKIDKFQKLRFSASKEIGKDWFEQMKRDWDAYMKAQGFQL